MNTLERLAREAWVGWGAYAKFTVCAGCGLFRYCHGRSSERMLCLDCFDLHLNR